MSAINMIESACTAGPNNETVWPAHSYKIGAGQELGNIYAQLANAGRAIAAGSSPGVGIGGHAQCGGIGFTTRFKGLAIDQLAAVDAVLANGTIMTVTPENNPNLWFALNGAGASSASIVHYYYKTFKAPPHNVIFSVYWESTPDKAAMAVQQVQKWTNTTDFDARFGMNLYLQPTGRQGQVKMSLNGVFQGRIEPFKAKCQDTLWKSLNGIFGQDYNVTSNATGTGIPGNDPTSDHATWVQSLRAYSGAPLAFNLSDLQEGYAGYGRSIVTDSIALDGARNLTDYVANQAYSWTNFTSRFFFVELHLVGGNQSAYSQEDKVSSSSFARRDALIIGQIFAENGRQNDTVPYAVPDDVKAGVNTMWSFVHKEGDGSYMCYPNLQNQGASNFGELYYGNNLDRLSNLKSQYDPRDIFSYPLSVPLPSS